ncbi:OmpA family protein [Cesiribacter sp. SM1]|uniref:OmpA family protein n=1 Tax=Cesiribacter sp. SM1 TaxID=2861196 RepID=UPI001CD3B463|nr:OmpA family protein [Cesiribacter sp. SM1]
MKQIFAHVGLLLLCLFWNGLPGFAQDCEGCKDHTLFSRMPNFYIVNYSSNYDGFEMRLPENESKNVEGQRTHIEYSFDYESGLQHPSMLQVKRNYQNAMKKIGGKVVLDGAYYSTMLVNKNGKEIWVNLELSNEGGFIYLDVVEVEAMQQEISANDMLEALNTNGFVALYINFDTSKASITADSQAIIDQVAELLNNNPELKLSIEGHTDNRGDAASNKALSEQRSKAVSSALVAKGVAANRLSSLGWGMEHPIADNRTEDGRALNRRVELVKK